MLSCKALEWYRFNDDFTHIFFTTFNPTLLLITQLMVVIGIKLPHYINVIIKLNNESCTTIISRIISFLPRAMRQIMVLWCRNFIATSIFGVFAIIFKTVASNEMLVNDIIRRIISLLPYSVAPVLSNDSIISIVSLLQPSVKQVCSYAIRISTNIPLVFPRFIANWYMTVYIKERFLNSSNPSNIALSLFAIGFTFGSESFDKNSRNSIASLFSDICGIFITRVVLPKVKDNKQANTNQRNAKVDRQVLIKDQKQLYADLQNATIHNQASNDKQKQLRMLNDDQQKLQNDHQNLQNDRQKLQNEKQKLHHDHQKLQNDHHTLQNEHQKLQNNQKKLHDHLVLPKVKDDKQANTNQQNAKLDRQDLIKVQKQLNTDLQSATVHNQASINDEHKQLQMLKYTCITPQKLKIQIRELKQAKHAAEKAKAVSEMKKDEEIQELSKRIHQLELELEREKRKSQMSNDKIRQMAELINELKQKYDKKVEEKKSLFSRIKQLKATECNQNCVIDVIRQICQTKVVGVDVQLCRRQLEKIIIKKVAEKIEKNDLKCEQLMEILEKDKIVARVAKEYKYPSEEEGKLQVIDEAWGKLMSIDSNERVLILGRVISNANKIGHAELCDLETRRDEEVKIYNPATDKEEWRNQEDFRDYVLGDDGLKLYTVNLEKLISIIEEYKDILSKH